MSKIFKRHRGVQSQIARELGVSRGAITHWLLDEGYPSAQIEAACRGKAAELLKEESSK